MQKINTISFALIFILTGSLHFILKDFMVAIVPPMLPAKVLLVYASGVVEMVLGILFLFPRLRSRVACLLILLLIAVFPANIYMYVAHEKFTYLPEWLLLIRLPLQFVMIYWAYGFTKCYDSPMTLKIYGAKLSFPCNKVLFVANFLGLEYEFIDVNLMKGEHKKPEFLKLHPFGKVPAIDDNGFALFESNTIIRYLAEKANSDLYPKEIKARMLVEQWLDFVTNHVTQAMTRVAFNRLFARNNPNMQYDEKSVEFGLELFDKFLPIIEAHLLDPANQGYLANAKLSLADFALLAALEPCEAAEVNTSQYQALNAYRQNLKSQDWYQKVYPSFEAHLRNLMQLN